MTSSPVRRGPVAGPPPDRSPSEAVHRLRRADAPAAAAAKAGFSPATAYRLEQDPQSPSQQDRPRRSRRRPDPLAGVFKEEIVPLLEASPTLRPIALFEELMRRRPELPQSVRRTLERRVRAWRAVNDPERDVVFRQIQDLGASGTVGHHRRLGARRHDHRRRAAAPPVSLPARLLGLRARPRRARGRELPGPGRGTSGFTLGARRRSGSQTDDRSA